MAKEGDIVKIITKDEEFTGILMPRPEILSKDIVVLNAAAAIIVGGLAEDFASAIKLAQASVSNGSALACLEKLIEVSNA